MLPPPVPPSDALTLRPIGPADLPAVSALAAEIHPSHPEADEVLYEKIALFPDGCRLLEMDGRPVGYILSHPWMRYAPPPLDTLMGALPVSPELFYIHDLALAPPARGTGSAPWMVATVLGVGAGMGLPLAALVAVGGSVPFWRRQGFATVERRELSEKLASYGSDAVYMERPMA